MNETNNAAIRYDYIISYSNSDAELVTKVVDTMENIYGAKCWFQLKNSKAEFIDSIMEGIEQSKAFIVFVSPDSANSYFVLNEINHAIEWRQEHEDYEILPVVIGPKEIGLGDAVYKKIRFYLGRLNMLFLDKEGSADALVRKIFEQTGFEIFNETLRESLYHASESEAKRLRAQNEILRDFSKDFFDETIGSEYCILDVGCADADNIMLRLHGRDYKKLLGVDIDGAQIEKANERYGGAQNRFVTCDIASDAFEDVLADYLEEEELAGFDLIHISAVLLHQSEPVKILRTLRRFLKKSGYLFIQDEDDGANLVYPSYNFFDLAFRIWADSKESGDRHCARKIPSYLKEAGYGKVRLLKCGVSNAGLDAEQSNALWDIYFNHHLWLAVDEDMFYNLAATRKLLEEYKAEYDKYKKEYDEGNIFIQLGFLLFAAQK